MNIVEIQQLQAIDFFYFSCSNRHFGLFFSDLPIQLFAKPPANVSTIGVESQQSASSSHLSNSINSHSLGDQEHNDDQPGTSRAPVWDPRQRRNE